jgi:hypothetical protein
MGSDIHLYAENKVTVPPTSLKEACKRVINAAEDSGVILEGDLKKLPTELQEYISKVKQDFYWEYIYIDAFEEWKENKINGINSLLILNVQST